MVEQANKDAAKLKENIINEAYQEAEKIKKEYEKELKKR
jgi:F0F1-type ATP synthase membrane subunit b/b'